MTDLRAALIEVLSENCSVPAHHISDDTKLGADLGMDSLDMIGVCMILEERQGVYIEVPDHVGRDDDVTVGELLGLITEPA